MHQGSVLLSFTGFTLGGGLMLARSPVMQRRWMRTWPHLIDSVLLASGVWLAVNLHLHPVNRPWLTAKLSALLLSTSRSVSSPCASPRQTHQAVALVAALLGFGYMVLVAMTRSVIPL